jgi:hypothetical protein
MTPKRESESRNDDTASALLDPAPFPKEMFERRRGQANDDLSSVLARAVFEYNLEAIYEGMSREVIKGNATVFKALAERGYGKAEDAQQLTDQIGVMRNEELYERLRQRYVELGIEGEIGEAG